MLAASAFAVAMVAVRILYTGGTSYANLVWNLVLAWIPFLIALAVYDRHRRGASRRSLAVPALVWLLFLPNAPYLVTDFFLLRWIGDAPVWFDVIMLTTFAWIGLALGFVSLFLMQAIARRLFGAMAAWTFAVGALALSSFGIYVGRVLRWNSWDALVQPDRLLADIWAHAANPWAYEKSVAMTVLFTCFLTAAYGVLYAWLRLALAEQEVQ
jgi:uncharacterized membrane protein